MRGSKTFAVWAGLLVGLASGAQAILPGEAAPDFTLTDTHGAEHTLSSQRGKVVLLAFIGYN